MAMFPRFTEGIGRLTADVLNRALALVESIPKITDRVDRLERTARRIEADRAEYWVFLTGYNSIGSNRWEYAWVKAIADSSNAGKFIVDSRLANDGETTLYTSSYSSYAPGSESSGTPFNKPAYNTIEAGNNGFANESAGVYVDGPAWPENVNGTPSEIWFLQPIRGGDGGGQPGQNPSEFDPDGASASKFWTTDLAPVVRLTLSRDDSGAVVRHFTVANDHDGECPP